MGSKPWRNVLAAVALLGATAEALAQTQAWTVTPSVGVRGTYTDNLSLAAAPDRGEFITELKPGIRIDGRSARLAGSLNYVGSALFHARENENDRLANTLNAFGQLEAIENLGFVEAQGNIEQRFISPFAPRPADITTATENRTEARSFSLSPFLRGGLPGGFSYELRNRNTWTSTDTGALADIHTRQNSASLASQVRLFGWSVDASDSRTTYEGEFRRPPQETRQARARLIFQPDISWRFSASVGKEENNFSLQQERSYDTYGVGVVWRPSVRTTAELNSEHRFFGTARLASLLHRTRLSAWNISYSKNITNSQQELLRLAPGNTVALVDSILTARIPDQAQRRAAVEQFFRNTRMPLFLSVPIAFYSEQVLLEERLQASIGILGVRNAITFTAFGSRSTALTEPLAGLPAELFLGVGNRIDQRGIGVSASHQLTSFTTANASANRIFAESADLAQTESRNDFLTAGLAHTIGPKTSTFAGVSYTRFASSTAPTTHARSAFAGMDHRF